MRPLIVIRELPYLPRYYAFYITLCGKSDHGCQHPLIKTTFDNDDILDGKYEDERSWAYTKSLSWAKNLCAELDLSEDIISIVLQNEDL